MGRPMFECQNVYWKMRRIVHPNTWNSRIPQEIVFLGHEEGRRAKLAKKNQRVAVLLLLCANEFHKLQQKKLQAMVNDLTETVVK